MKLRLNLAAAGLAAAFFTSAALADVKVGVLVSATGPAAAIGLPMKNAVPLLPKELAGQKIEYIVLDDGGDPTKSVTNARKLITEDNVDVLVGSSITPTSIPLVDIAGEVKIPLLATVPTMAMVQPMDEKRRWVFKMPQNDSLMAEAIAAHMEKAGVKTVAYIGYNDGYGEGWFAEVDRIFPMHGIKILVKETFARADTSVTGQVLKLMAANADVVFIAASGTPAVLPQKTLRERGFTKQVYQTHGISTMDFIRVGGKDVEGTIFPAGPMTVAAQLDDSNPIKKSAVEFTKAYEEMYKIPMAAFAGHMVDTSRMIEAALPAALAKAKPGTPEFRAALRDALENTKEVVLTHGIMNMTPTNHCGFDERARVMLKIENGQWKII